MRLSPLLLALCFACTPTTTVVGGGEKGDAADTGGEDIGDTDTAADTDTGEEVKDPTPGDYAGDYEGDNVGEFGSSEWSAACEGGVEFTIDETGAIEGFADCTFEQGGGGWTQEGDIAGDVDAEGSVFLVWTVDFGRETLEIEGAGQIVDGAAAIEVYADLGRSGEYFGEMTPELR
jgi:hypothetical protein